MAAIPPISAISVPVTITTGTPPPRLYSETIISTYRFSALDAARLLGVPVPDGATVSLSLGDGGQLRVTVREDSRDESWQG